LASNTGGDITGVSPADIQFSLVRDGRQTANGNLSGDPRFTNPGSDDYSLRTGSPAIDAGTNTATSLPFLDYFQRLRVASATAAAGEGRVDMGPSRPDRPSPCCSRCSRTPPNQGWVTTPEPIRRGRALCDSSTAPEPR